MPMRRVCVVIKPMPEDLPEDKESLIIGYLDGFDFRVVSTDIPLDGVEPGDTVTFRDLIGVDVEIVWNNPEAITLNWDEAADWVDWKADRK